MQTAKLADIRAAGLSSWRWRIVVPLGILVAAFLLWNEVFKYRFIAKRWGVVEAGTIYRSGQLSKWMVEKTLAGHHIGVVVDLTSLETGNEHQQAELAAVRKLGIKHVRLPLLGDGTGEIGRYAEAIKVVVDCERSGIPVLVHCAAGADRTGGVFFAYRTLVQKRSPADACNEMQRYNWRPGDENPLPDYLNSHMAELASLLVQSGVLDRVPDKLPRLEP